MQKCTVTLRFPKLKALMPVHQGLTTLMILINHHDCVNVYENGFVSYHNFFVTMYWVSQNVDGTVSNFKRTLPLQNKTIRASRVRILDANVQNIETELTL